MHERQTEFDLLAVSRETVFLDTVGSSLNERLEVTNKTYNSFVNAPFESKRTNVVSELFMDEPPVSRSFGLHENS